MAIRFENAKDLGEEKPAAAPKLQTKDRLTEDTRASAEPVAELPFPKPAPAEKKGRRK
jgi:hypothetical protein